MMEMTGDNKAWVITAICAALFLITVTGCITYHSTQHDEFRLKMIDRGVNPIVLDCLSSDLSTNGTAAILCFDVFKKANVTPEDTKKLRDILEEGNGR